MHYDGPSYWETDSNIFISLENTDSCREITQNEAVFKANLRPIFQDIGSWSLLQDQLLTIAIYRHDTRS